MNRMGRTGTGGPHGPGGLGRASRPGAGASVMRELGLEACQPRPWRFSLTEGDGQEPDIPDLVKRDFTAGAPGEKMVGDITYLPTWQGWLYLATVIDCHTKEGIGRATDDNHKTPLIDRPTGSSSRNLPSPLTPLSPSPPRPTPPTPHHT